MRRYNMGGLFGGGRSPAPTPTPARPVTAVAKTPDIELDDTDLESTSLNKKKTGKKALRTDITMDSSVDTGSTGSGLQIPK
tara:strand:- start:9266 stop:9508 length:243 start_codon:yes stop_codon:yes gene_type:complete